MPCSQFPGISKTVEQHHTRMLAKTQTTHPSYLGFPISVYTLCAFNECSFLSNASAYNDAMSMSTLSNSNTAPVRVHSADFRLIFPIVFPSIPLALAVTNLFHFLKIFSFQEWYKKSFTVKLWDCFTHEVLVM